MGKKDEEALMEEGSSVLDRLFTPVNRSECPLSASSLPELTADVFNFSAEDGDRQSAKRRRAESGTEDTDLLTAGNKGAGGPGRARDIIEELEILTRKAPKIKQQAREALQELSLILQSLNKSEGESLGLRNPPKTAGTQTDDREEDYGAAKIAECIREADTYEEVSSILNLKWPEAVFINTSMSAANPLINEDTTLVVCVPERENIGIYIPQRIKERYSMILEVVGAMSMGAANYIYNEINISDATGNVKTRRECLLLNIHPSRSSAWLPSS